MNVLRLGFQLLLTAAGVIILDPASAPWTIAFALVFSAVAYFSNVIQREREMRLFTHDGALSRFYLDALLGLIPVRMHGAERSMRREHETLLTGWTRSSLDTWRIVVILQGISATPRRVLGHHPLEFRGARGRQATCCCYSIGPSICPRWRNPCSRCASKSRSCGITRHPAWRNSSLSFQDRMIVNG